MKRYAGYSAVLLLLALSACSTAGGGGVSYVEVPSIVHAPCNPPDTLKRAVEAGELPEFIPPQDPKAFVALSRDGFDNLVQWLMALKERADVCAAWAASISSFGGAEK